MRSCLAVLVLVFIPVAAQASPEGVVGERLLDDVPANTAYFAYADLVALSAIPQVPEWLSQVLTMSVYQRLVRGLNLDILGSVDRFVLTSDLVYPLSPANMMVMASGRFQPRDVAAGLAQLNRQYEQRLGTVTAPAQGSAPSVYASASRLIVADLGRNASAQNAQQAVTEPSIVASGGAFGDLSWLSGESHDLAVGAILPGELRDQLRAAMGMSSPEIDATLQALQLTREQLQTAVGDIQAVVLTGDVSPDGLTTRIDLLYPSLSAADVMHTVLTDAEDLLWPYLQIFFGMTMGITPTGYEASQEGQRVRLAIESPSLS